MWLLVWVARDKKSSNSICRKFSTFENFHFVPKSRKSTLNSPQEAWNRWFYTWVRVQIVKERNFKTARSPLLRHFQRPNKNMMKPMYEAPSVGSRRQKKFEFDFSKILTFGNFHFVPRSRKSRLNSRWLARNRQFKVRVREQTMKERENKTARSP